MPGQEQGESMRKMRSFFTGLILAGSMTCAVAAGADAQPGKTQEIPFEKNPRQSYSLYYPNRYNPNREHKWPVLFVLAAPGGGSGRVNLYTEGADRNQFVLVSMPCIVEDNDRTMDLQLVMIDEVIGKYPIDETRCYFSGFGKEAATAFVLSAKRKRNILGLLVADSGCEENGHYNSRAAVYGFCHAAHRGVRTEMVLTFYQLLAKKSCKLRFLPGAGGTPDSALVAEGMDWLNWQYMTTANNSAQDKSFNAEKAAFAKNLADRIQTDRVAHPEAAYEWSLLLSQVRGVPEAAVAKAANSQLAADPKVRLYLEAAKDIDKFVEKNFIIPLVSADRNGKSIPPTRTILNVKKYEESLAKDARKLQEKYKTTLFGEILPSFGGESK